MTALLDRRGLLAAGGMSAWAVAMPAWAATPSPQTVPLRVSPIRTTTLTVWQPARPRGVVMFSAGHGSWPERYAVLIAALLRDGFAILAPLHVDSVHYPDRDKFSLPQSFPERLADMAATSTYAAANFAGLPAIAVGHSFGTLTALCLGGALRDMGTVRDPSVRAVLGFSSPGRIPGLIQPTAYATVAVPVMIVTGTADTVPGFVTDPVDHLFPAQSAPTETFALVEAGADHGLVAEDTPAAIRARLAASLFAQGYGLDDPGARRRMGRWHAHSGETFTHKAAR